MTQFNYKCKNCPFIFMEEYMTLFMKMAFDFWNEPKVDA